MDTASVGGPGGRPPPPPQASSCGLPAPPPAAAANGQRQHGAGPGGGPAPERVDPLVARYLDSIPRLGPPRSGAARGGRAEAAVAATLARAENTLRRTESLLGRDSSHRGGSPNSQPPASGGGFAGRPGGGAPRRPSASESTVPCTVSAEIGGSERARSIHLPATVRSSVALQRAAACFVTGGGPPPAPRRLLLWSNAAAQWAEVGDMLQLRSGDRLLLQFEAPHRPAAPEAPARSLPRTDGPDECEDRACHLPSLQGLSAGGRTEDDESEMLVPDDIRIHAFAAVIAQQHTHIAELEQMLQAAGLPLGADADARARALRSDPVLDDALGLLGTVTVGGAPPPLSSSQTGRMAGSRQARPAASPVPAPPPALPAPAPAPYQQRQQQQPADPHGQWTPAAAAPEAALPPPHQAQVWLPRGSPERPAGAAPGVAATPGLPVAAPAAAGTLPEDCWCFLRCPSTSQTRSGGSPASDGCPGFVYKKRLLRAERIGGKLRVTLAYEARQPDSTGALPMVPIEQFEAADLRYLGRYAEDGSQLMALGCGFYVATQHTAWVLVALSEAALHSWLRWAAEWGGALSLGPFAAPLPVAPSWVRPSPQPSPHRPRQH